MRVSGWRGCCLPPASAMAEAPSHPPLNRTLSTLTLADQIANALASIELEGRRVADPLELTSIEVTQQEWARSDEQPRPSDLCKKRVIGEGGYSCVYLAHDLRTSRQFALKCIKKCLVANNGVSHRLLAEKEAYEELRHPFICRLFSTFQDEDSLYFVLELARGGDLFEVIDTHGGRLPEDWARHYLGSVALGIQHMHSRGYVYRDLKPENVLIDHKGFVKIADMGYAKFIKGERTYSTLGTFPYTPPELIDGRGRTTAADWWGCGVLLHEMLVGEPPFKGETSRDILRSVKRYSEEKEAADRIRDNLQRLKVSIAAIDMVFGLLHVEESRRLGTTHFHSIQHHPWFEGFDWVALLRREVTPPYVPRADLILPDVSDRLCPSVMTADDFDRQAWAHIFDEFGPMAKLHGE